MAILERVREMKLLMHCKMAKKSYITRKWTIYINVNENQGWFSEVNYGTTSRENGGMNHDI